MAKLTISSSEFQSQVSDLLPCNNFGRSQLTHALLKSFSLLEHFDELIEQPVCFKKDLLQFHSNDYVEAILDDNLNTVLPFDEDEQKWSYLQGLAAFNGDETQWVKSRMELFSRFKIVTDNISTKSRKRSISVAQLEDVSDEDLDDLGDKTSETSKHDLKRFNLEGDCPLFSYLPMYCQVITGATLMLADNTVKGERSIGINWDGGRHHAFKQKASGFCYVNDIVLLIQKLRKKGYQRISYVDFDLHHGDGVEKAFQFSPNVQTVSLHMLEVGFFPGTGALSNSNKGKNVVNIPLLHGLDDESLVQLTEELIKPLVSRHAPEVLIIQCGGDGLMGDGFNEWQLSIKGLTKCITEVINATQDCPVVLLGGGGYNVTLMSRFYVYLTSKILKLYSSSPSSVLNIDSDTLIPDHEFADVYADEGYEFWAYEQEGGLRKKHLKNENDENLIYSLKRHYNV